MNRIEQIKADQREAAKKAGLNDPYAVVPKAQPAPEVTEAPTAPAPSNPPAGRIAQIKAEQAKLAEKTGIDTYDTEHPDNQKPAGDLAHYQGLLEIDIAKIAAEKDIKDKNRVKSALLPQYQPFINDYIKQGHNYPNDVAVQVMIWQLDTLDIENGLNLALLLVKQGQRMPAKFDRDMQTFLCDEFYDWANDSLKNDLGVSPYLDTLVSTAEQDNWDVHPLCMSKLYVILAKHKERSGDYKEALALCEKAEAVNPDKAGVKGLKERLEKQLKS